MTLNFDRRTVVRIALATLLLDIAAPRSAQAEDKFIIVQSTTSTQDSGLFDHILPIFTKKTGIDVRVVAVGTGQALKNAENGDGDVVLVHSKPDEEKFVAEGWGVKRQDVMYNDFVIVGPLLIRLRSPGSRTRSQASRRLPKLKRCLPHAATTPAPTRPRSNCGRMPVSTPSPRAASGTSRPAPAWARPSTRRSANRLTRDRSRHLAQFCQQG